MMLPGSAAIPAVHADRLRNCEETGALAAQIFRNFPIDEIYVQYAKANIGADRLATGVGFRYADRPGMACGEDQRVAVMYRS